jgi:ubiquinone/menaquinone biosynthesis C-methylase UbiE
MAARKGFLEDAKCPWWICWSFDNPLRRLIHSSCRIMEGLVREGETALDLGCGEGYFTIDIARMVGDSGHVYAVDLQEHMLKVLRRRAGRAKVDARIETILASPDKLITPSPVDFVLAFWMIHEVPDKDRLYVDIAAAMKSGGRFLVVEPKWHVSRESFQESLQLAETTGLRQIEERPVRFSRAIVFQKQNT